MCKSLSETRVGTTEAAVIPKRFTVISTEIMEITSDWMKDRSAFTDFAPFLLLTYHLHTKMNR